MNITIRKALPGEEEKILDLYNTLIDLMKESPYRPTWTKGVYPVLSDIADAVAEESMYIAEESIPAVETGNPASGGVPGAGAGRVVGAFFCCRKQADEYRKVPWQVDSPPDRTVVIHLLAVDPRYHNRGIAKLLLQKAVDVCRKEGDLAIRLDTLPHNKPGRRMYESFGFEWRGDVELTYPSTGAVPFSMYEYRL